MLTAGWLILIDNKQRFIRLVAALIISIAYLSFLFGCAPYRKAMDWALAAGTQLLLVFVFIGGLVVRLFEDIANDTSGSVELATRFLGFSSSEEAVTLMIVVALAVLIVFGACLAAHAAFHARRLHLESKYLVCTVEPPNASWRPDRVYAVVRGRGTRIGTRVHESQLVTGSDSKSLMFTVPLALQG